MRVCYMGAYSPTYPRNLILRRGLAANGVTVIECRVDSSLNSKERIAKLKQKFERVKDQCDVIFLSEFNQTLVPAIHKLAQQENKRFVVDAFTPVYDANVNDRRSVPSFSLKALRYWMVDRASVRLPDIVLVDTEQHADYYIQKLNADRSKLHVVPVGASSEWFGEPTITRTEPGIKVLFYGTYIPLHGIDIILRAAVELRANDAIHFELIGKGQTYKQMRDLAIALRLTNVRFADPVPYEELPKRVSSADICLGIFGQTDKAARVVPNKVYQTLAVARPLITADTPAIRSVFKPDTHLLAVPAGNPHTLAQAITTLVDNLMLRTKLAEAGHQLMLERYTEGQIGKHLLNILSAA